MGALLPLAQLTESGLPRAKKRCLATVSIPFLQAPASLLLHNCRLCGVVLKCSARRDGYQQETPNQLDEKSPRR